MASSFKSIDLFGSGPHRFVVGKQGSFIVTGPQLGSWIPDTTSTGLVELVIEVRGRLVAASESALWSLRDAIAAQLLQPPTAGTLVDHGGRTFASMSLVGYDELGPTDRGQRWSLGYVATFRRFTSPP
jgi:hypothetical protein